MGYMLFNERMLESYIHARKWLKPGGRIYLGFLCLASSCRVGWSPILFFSEMGEFSMCVVWRPYTSTVYCLHQLCIVYVDRVLFTSTVYCLHQSCIVYINRVLFTSTVYCLCLCCRQDVSNAWNPLHRPIHRWCPLYGTIQQGKLLVCCSRLLLDTIVTHCLAYYSNLAPACPCVQLL